MGRRIRVALGLALLGSGLMTVAMAGEGPPGTEIRVDTATLPPPYATPAAHNPPEIVPAPPGAGVDVPAGFQANAFARDLPGARNLTVAPNGDVLVTIQHAGEIKVLRDGAGRGRADVVETLATGFSQPFGLVIRPDGLYVGDTRGVWRLAYRPGDLKVQAPPQRLTPPGALGEASGHVTRTVAFAPDGRRFYVAVGSSGNLAEEPVPRATIQEFAADGTPLGTFAAGLRNPVGLAFRPGSDELYTVVNERDGLGDGLVPDYLTRVERGAFYGWPYAYLGGHPQPGLAERRPELVAQSRMPDLLFESHSAPLGLVFYQGDQFPAEYRGDAFVARHGSWNRSDPVGYDVVRVHFENGRPAGTYQRFATGFRLPGPDKGTARVWGRPVGLAVAQDGSLLAADDAGGSIWRIAYGHPAR